MEAFWAFFVVLMLLILYVVYKFAYAPFQVFKSTGVSGPPPVPLFGNYLELRKKALLEFERDIYRKYGRISGYYIGQDACFLVADIEMVNQITIKHFPSFMSGRARPKMSEKVFPNGLLFAQGEEWRLRRRIVAPTFSASKMKLMVPMIEKIANTLVEVMGDTANSKKSGNMLKLYGSFTMESIMAVAFGRAIEVQRGEADSLTKAASTIFSDMKRDLRYVQFILSNFPWIDPLLAYFMKPTESFSTITSTILHIVQARRKERKGKYQDLLQLMMDATGDKEEEEEEEKEEGKKTTSKDPSNNSEKLKLTDEEVMMVSFDALLAGYDTTANTLAFASYVLALHPHVQEKLQAEIDQYFEDYPEASLYEATTDIKYLEMVVSETLRVYPVGRRTVRKCNEATTINGIHFPKGCLAVIPVHLIHHDPEYWPDPTTFDPMRFAPEEKAKRPKNCFIPFGSGPRRCVGMRLALLEAKIALVQVLRHFTFVRAPDTEVPLHLVIGVTLTSVNPIHLNVVRRE